MEDFISYMVMEVQVKPVWNMLSAVVRPKGEIVLNVTSSSIASLNLPNRRTAHSRFKIPLNINESSTCNIKQGTPHAKLISKAKLIIRVEAPMVSKFCFEALNRCLKDILRYDDAYNAYYLMEVKWLYWEVILGKFTL